MPGRSSAAISVTGNGWSLACNGCNGWSLACNGCNGWSFACNGCNGWSLTCNGWSLASSRCHSLFRVSTSRIRRHTVFCSTRSESGWMATPRYERYVTGAQRGSCVRVR
jgi:hypothetical protein